MCTVWFLFTFIFVLSKNFSEASQCSIYNEISEDHNKIEKDLLARLDQLENSNKIFSLKGVHIENNSTYFYKFGICTTVDSSSKYKNTGAIQYSTALKGLNYSLGQIDQSQIMGGDDWILLTYLGGNEYGSRCNKTSRITKLMLKCDREKEEDEASFITEQVKQHGSDCYYLFELKTSKVCPPQSPKSLSTGSILCILFFTSVGVYLIFGIMYQRYVVGAKDIEQIPNYAFWKNFGSLQVDGCNYLCQCGRRKNSYVYKGIDSEDAEPDEPLLN